MLSSISLFAFAAPATVWMMAGLPINSNFDADTPGSPPALGGPDQPSWLNLPGGGSILVQTSSTGITTQPVELYDDTGEYVSVNYSFPAVMDEVVRVEATISVDQFVSGYMIQTGDAGTAVLARLQFDASGGITALSNTPMLGSYQPNVPFRVRIDNDIVNYSYAVTVDEEMDGFGDNTTFSGLTFVNSSLTDIGVALMSLNEYGAGVGVTIAYDDIYIGTVPDEPGAAFCFGNTSQGNPCPCINDNDQTDPAAGCANGTYSAGAALTASGVASVSADTLLLVGTRGQPSNSSMFFQAENSLDGGGAFLGDGIRCAGGNLKRLKVKLNDANGDADTTGTVITTRSAALGYTIVAGDTLRYQWWYRDTNNPPCGLGVNDSNTSNGYEITWLP